MHYPRKVILLGILLASLAGSAYLAGPQSAEAGSYGMGSGMMGSGMMGSGMMGPGMMGPPRGAIEATPEPVNPARAEALLSYLHEHNSACLQCHVVSGTSFGPPFALIAANYASHADAKQLLAQHIAHGFGRMPPGLASDVQAAELAKLILELSETEPPKHVEKAHP